MRIKFLRGKKLQFLIAVLSRNLPQILRHQVQMLKQRRDLKSLEVVFTEWVRRNFLTFYLYYHLGKTKGIQFWKVF